jgi:hypothetical protein
LKERTEYIFPLAPLKENPEKRLVTQNKEHILEKEPAKKKALKTRELKPIKKKLQTNMMKPCHCEVDAKNDTEFCSFETDIK